MWNNAGMDRGTPADEEQTRPETEQIAVRTARRRTRMVVHRARSFADAANWDLEYWQSRTPAQRIAAYRALLHDVTTVQQSRRRDADGSGMRSARATSLAQRESPGRFA